ncbi:nitrite reductase (NAD(P)H) small subunit [Bacillus massilinigeriensis]|uniref:nitrite reductase (NAD(P)H) small subunit n=1 Tax=Bacillus massilionigeriensis TaxID=1805475 RepID=UPI00096B2FDE|nr:nitrite reductase (NAD(P)H) small subunit [Bacillus massilionigeriensis]
MEKTLQKIEVASFSSLPERMGQVVRVNGEDIVLFRLTNGTVRAIENRSPSPKGGTLSDGLVSGEYVYCPISDWKISLTDGSVEAPGYGQVKIYPIEVTENSIYLFL